MRFYSCKSYKKGKYRFNLYKNSEITVIIVSFIIAIQVLNKSSNWASIFPFVIIFLGIVIGFTAPIPQYHAVYYFIYYLIKKINTKKYISKGVAYVLEKEEQRSIETAEDTEERIK